MNTLNLDFLRHSIEQMKEKGIAFDKGLSAEEIAIAENRYSIRFPPDLRAFLELAMPLPNVVPDPDRPWYQPTFPNWRTHEEADDKFIRYGLEWPKFVLATDAEHRKYWIAEWGEMPEDPTKRKEITKVIVDQAPQLIPVYSHRYIPATPYEAGNPIFSVYGFDTVLGNDLADYLANEFGIDKPEWATSEPKEIEFWSNLVRHN